MSTALRAQLAGELHLRLVVPTARLLGLDLADMVEARLEARADILAAQLRSADDDERAETAIDVLTCLWPGGWPPDDWRTELGRACAESLGTDDAEAVTYSVAAAMLGVTKGTVSTLVQRGSLDRHPDGGVTRASVFVRLVRLGGEGTS